MRALAALTVLAALAASAQEGPRIPDPMPVDDSPTPWACTMEKLLLGERCVLEVEPKASRDPAAQAQQNIAWAGGAAARACAATRSPRSPGRSTISVRAQGGRSSSARAIPTSGSSVGLVR